jgi:Aspartyl protease
MRIVRLSLAFSCLLALSSCSTTPPPSAFVPASELPAPVAMNDDTGRGGWLIVPVRLEHGNEMPFLVDTGAPFSFVDESLEPELGKRILAGTAIDGSLRKHKMHLYRAASLYLGNTQLMTGSFIGTMDLKRQLSTQTHCPVMGILGMDCMSHYCIQLDFKSEQLRFLNPNDLDIAALGKAFPLTFSSAELPGHHWCGGTLIKASPLTSFSARPGGNRRARPSIQFLDTGDNADGTLSSVFFRREVHEQRLEAKEDVDVLHPNTNTWASLDKCVWEGETYTNLTVGNPNGGGAIGLRFLARHLVTFNFPQRVMYLKQTSIGPLPDVDRVAAWKFILASVRKKGGLPGAPPHGTAYIDNTTSWPEDTFECVVCPKQDSTRYHYLIARTFENASWKLQKAWKTDAQGRTIEEYPVP